MEFKIKKLAREELLVDYIKNLIYSKETKEDADLKAVDDGNVFEIYLFDKLLMTIEDGYVDGRLQTDILYDNVFFDKVKDTIEEINRNKAISI